MTTAIKPRTTAEYTANGRGRVAVKGAGWVLCLGPHDGVVLDPLP